MGRFGGLEIVLIAVVALLLFGGSKIADLGKGLGEGIKNFKKGLKDPEPGAGVDSPSDPTKKS